MTDPPPVTAGPSPLPALAVLAEPLRRDLYRYVADRPAPVSRDQAAEALALPRHTVKFHLDKLVDAGLLATEYRRVGGRAGPGAGRPTKLYRAAVAEVSASVPDRHYDLAAALLAEAVAEAAADGSSPVEALDRAADAAGRRWGAALEGAGDRVAALCELLAEQGYEPDRAAGAVRLANCPFHRLARAHTSLVCGMNESLLTGLVESLPGGLRARLDPAAGRCCVTIDVPDLPDRPDESASALRG